MYSLLLMTAMAGSPDASTFGWRAGGCYGCYGGTTVTASCHGCTGASCFGCTGFTTCNGCTGSSCHGSFLGIVDRHRARVAARHACHGSCYGSCFGSCQGVSCYGGCYGSCHGAACYGGCYGSCHGAACYGAGCVGTPVASATWINPIPSVSNYTPAETTTTAVHAPAQLAVELPATAKLYVDGNLISGTGTIRHFHTPTLQSGQAYFYELKAEIEVNGKLTKEEQKVIVRSGQTQSASFQKLFAAASGENAGTTVASK